MEKVTVELEFDARVWEALQESARESGSTLEGVISRLIRLDRERTAIQGTQGLSGVSDEEFLERLRAKSPATSAP